MVSQLWSWRAPRRDVSSADPRSIGPAATRCGRAAACQQRLEASSCGPPQQLAQTLHLDHVVAVEVAHLLADDPVHKYLHPCLLLRGIQARQREARAFVKRRGPLGALFGHADVEGLLREKRRGFGAVGKGASGHRARGQPGAWRKGGERGRASVGSGIQLSHKTRGDVVLERGSGKAHLEVARAPAVVHRAVSPSDTAQKTLQTGQPRRRSERRCTWGRAPPRPKGRLSPRQPFAHRSSWVQPKVRPSRSASLLYARVTRATRGAPQPTNEAPP
jgi:hypothetical protein